MSLMIVGAIGLFIIFHHHPDKTLLEKVRLEAFGYILFGVATTLTLLYLFGPIPVINYYDLQRLNQRPQRQTSFPMNIDFSGCFGGAKKNKNKANVKKISAPQESKDEAAKEGGILNYVV